MRHAMKKVQPSQWMVDMSYQREPDLSRVEFYAANFREELFGTPTLSERQNGELFVVDGNHRRLTLEKAGNDNARMCWVISGLTVEDEAQLFHDLNSNKHRRGHTAHGQFKARVRFKEPIALEIMVILKHHGKRIDVNKTPRTISAVLAVEAAHRRGVLGNTLSVLCGWDGDNPAAFDGPIIHMVSRFLEAYRDGANVGHLVKRLKTETPASLVAHVRREKHDFGYSAARAAVSVLRRIYNRRTPKSKCLALPEGF